MIRIAHAIAVARPGDLEKFAETNEKVGDETSSKQTRCRSDECQRFIELLSSALWRVLEKTPANAASGCLGQPGLTHVETTV